MEKKEIKKKEEHAGEFPLASYVIKEYKEMNKKLKEANQELNRTFNETTKRAAATNKRLSIIIIILLVLLAVETTYIVIYWESLHPSEGVIRINSE